MSVSFYIEGDRWDVENEQDHRRHINLANSNARELLDWLKIPHDELYGGIQGKELAVKCRRRLWDEPRNHDPERPVQVEQSPDRATVITCARDEDYLRTRTQWLLTMAEYAGERMVLFG